MASSDCYGRACGGDVSARCGINLTLVQVAQEAAYGPRHAACKTLIARSCGKRPGRTRFDNREEILPGDESNQLPSCLEEFGGYRPGDHFHDERQSGIRNRPVGIVQKVARYIF